MNPVILTYTELEQYLHGFNNGHLDTLIIVGVAGLQKSVTAEKICKTARCLNGSVTAFEFYRELWRNRDKDFILDDVDQLYADRAAVRLLKSVCDTKLPKLVHWHSAAAQLVTEGIPNQFETTTRVIIIANEWKTLNRNVGALQDRGHVLRFQPTAAEVHARTKGWFKDKEVFQFIGANLHLNQQPSMRYYVTASQLKAAGLDWRSALLKSWQVSDYAAEVLHLLNDERLSQKERAGLFQQRTGGCRATFFNILRRLRQANGETAYTFRPNGQKPNERRAA